MSEFKPRRTEEIRKTLLDYELLIANAEATIERYDNEYALYSKLGGKRNAAMAMQAKIYSTTYKTFLENMNNAREELVESINYCLRGYNDKWRKVWVLYFLEDKPLSEISKRVGYATKYISEILAKMRDDLKEDEEDVQSDVQD